MQEKIEAGHLKQVLIGLVDVSLTMLFVVMVSIYCEPLFLHKIITSVNATLVVVICLVLYRLVSIFFFNATIGMKLFSVVLLNGEEQSLSVKEKLLAAIFILYRGADYYNH